MANSELYEVFWPGGPSAVHTVPSAPRSDLTGKRIGFLWDYVFRGEEIFPILEKVSQRDTKMLNLLVMKILDQLLVEMSTLH